MYPIYVTTNKNAYNLRSNIRKLCLPKLKTNFLKIRFSYRGAASWICFPLEIVNEYEHLSDTTFKNMTDYRTLIQNNF